MKSFVKTIKSIFRGIILGALSVIAGAVAIFILPIITYIFYPISFNLLKFHPLPCFFIFGILFLLGLRYSVKD